MFTDDGYGEQRCGSCSEKHVEDVPGIPQGCDLREQEHR